MHASNPWLAGLSGFGLALVILALVMLFGMALSFLTRTVLKLTNAEWKALRVRRFWVINTAFAPLSLGLLALIAHQLGLTWNQVGFNANQLGLSLAISLPIALALGSLSAWAARTSALQGENPLKVPFATKTDVFGSIAYMAILVGPLEEIPFRGILQTILQRAMPQTAHLGSIPLSLGAFIAALLFVLYHVRNVFVGGESLRRFALMIPGRLVLSLIMASLFEATGSLIGPIIFHNLVDTCTITSLATTIYSLRQRGLWREKSATEQPA